MRNKDKVCMVVRAHMAGGAMAAMAAMQTHNEKRVCDRT